jgi:hypothetical protein
MAMSCVREVQSWGTPHATPAPHVEVESEVKPEVEAVATEEPEAQPEAEAVATEEPEAQPEAQAVVTKQSEAVKPRKTRSKKAHLTPKLQPMSVGAAAVDYAAMTSEQLRKECAIQGIEWRNGGDYGKPMKKAQMLAALK